MFGNQSFVKIMILVTRKWTRGYQKNRKNFAPKKIRKSNKNYGALIILSKKIVIKKSWEASNKDLAKLLN